MKLLLLHKRLDKIARATAIASGNTQLLSLLIFPPRLVVMRGAMCVNRRGAKLGQVGLVRNSLERVKGTHNSLVPMTNT